MFILITRENIKFINSKISSPSVDTSRSSSDPYRSGGGVGKGRRACNYVSGIEYLHRKGRFEILIGGDDINNDVSTLGTCFSMFVYIRARFSFAARAPRRACSQAVYLYSNPNLNVRILIHGPRPKLCLNSTLNKIQSTTC